MKHWTLFMLLTMILVASCEKDSEDMNPDEEVIYIQDNIFGCEQFEVMETSAGFTVNVEPSLEVFNDFFVYEDSDGLVINDGFNGPTLETYDMQVNDMKVFNEQLILCADEGVFRLNAAGELDTISGQRCYSMTLDGQSRLMLQGTLGDPGSPAYTYIHEYKNNTLVPFAGLPGFFGCSSVKLERGSEAWLYGVSCDNEIAAYENGVVKAELDDGVAPLFTRRGGWGLFEYYNGGLIAIVMDFSDAFRMYKLVDDQWLPFYDLEYEGESSDKINETLVYVDHNLLIHDGYLYTFGTGGNSEQRPAIGRFDVSGDAQKDWEDIELIQIPGLSSREIVDIVVASDGSAYAVMTSKQIVKLTCD